MKKRWEHIKSTFWFKILSNKFVIASIAFVVWMTFLDSNSWLIHSELNKEIQDLEESKAYYQKQIEEDQRQLEELTSDPEKLEKFAREQYWLRKPGEEIYLIKQD